MIRPSIACEIWAFRSFGRRLSGSQPSAWSWVWSWDPLRFVRRYSPHHLSPAWVNHPAGQDPEACLSRSRSPQQRSNQPRKPVNSHQDSSSLFSAAVVQMVAENLECPCAAIRSICGLSELSRAAATPGKIVFSDAKRLLQHYLPIADIPSGRLTHFSQDN